ncbi:MAG: GH3 auxin-responsive promoter family protein [Gemmatimonadetes bacterium]|nr:GH3 auxin-responsive promoter family protein [Gemmatimonadota bacterium]
MSVGAAVANALWLATGLGATRRFDRALGDADGAQRRWLLAQVRRHAACEFGRTHDFGAFQSPADFVRRVPLSSYEDVAPAIERLRRGAPDVLATGRVTHLAPTSGSSGARKLIPFTATLQSGFNAAVSRWVNDLVRRRPALVGGPAYWSVSPLTGEDAERDRMLPARCSSGGLADDADYLGGGAAWLVRQALAAPSSLRHVRDPQAFWGLTALALLRRRDLRLISIWHPSFLDLLVEGAASMWLTLIDAITSGDCPWIDALPEDARGRWRVAPNASRGAELRRIGTDDWARWWPELQLVSCWGEQAAEAGWRALVQRLPHVLVQPKGLLATEGVVTIPLHATHVLAVTSHFFEFIDEHGEVRLAHELARGGRYGVVITNGAGLWRYRLGDVVECTGHVRTTPTLRFLGRGGRVSDLRGEKLSEPFVAEALREACSGRASPAYAALRAWSEDARAGYELLISNEVAVAEVDAMRTRLETALHANPHYALARRLGQLDAVRAVVVAPNTAIGDLRAHEGRLGDAKPRILLSITDAPR